MASEEIGTLFQQFVLEVFLARYPDLLSFAGMGRDGGIDLSQTRDNARTIIECKAIGEDGIQQSQQRWRKVARHLQTNLQEPAGPPSGQPQYGPWYRREVPIREYIFCSSSKLGGQENLDRLRKEISDFFDELANKHAHLNHLRGLEVSVLDWNHFESQLLNHRRVAFRWFPGSLLSGFSLLDDFRLSTGFRSYLDNDRLPYFSRTDYLSTRSVPSSTIVSEEDLLVELEEGSCTGIIITGVGGVGKSRLTLELGRKAQQRNWVAVRAKSSLNVQDLDSLVQNAGNALRVPVCPPKDLPHDLQRPLAPQFLKPLPPIHRFHAERAGLRLRAVPLLRYRKLGAAR